MGSPQSGHRGGTGASDDMRAQIALDSAGSLILIKYSVRGVAGTNVGAPARLPPVVGTKRPPASALGGR
jgi:hypothetical protein